MKKIYQTPNVEEIVVHMESLLGNPQSIEVSSKTQNNSNAFSRESGGWDDDY